MVVMSSLLPLRSLRLSGETGRDTEPGDPKFPFPSPHPQPRDNEFTGHGISIDPKASTRQAHRSGDALLPSNPNARNLIKVEEGRLWAQADLQSPQLPLRVVWTRCGPWPPSASPSSSVKRSIQQEEIRESLSICACARTTESAPRGC